MEWYGTGWDGTERYEWMERDGTGWNGMEQDGTGWNRMEREVEWEMEQEVE